MKLSIDLTEESFQDVVHLSQGVFHPLKGFMSSADYKRVVSDMKLVSGDVWTIPVTLEVNRETFARAQQSDRAYFAFAGKEVGFIEIEDCFQTNPQDETKHVFGTSDSKHPGAAKELHRSIFRIGGKIVVTDSTIVNGSLNPEKTRDIFSKKGWKTIAAFHTRNPVHRAHEHLQRTALEICDGLFINPFLGWKKAGDFSDEAIMQGYRALIDNYYPKDRVYLEGFRSSMRYAGPREAIFHAIIRRNLGCTHIIVGRDHAGVGEYYGKYEAQELCRKITAQDNLGINFLLLNEPFFCNRCGEVVSEKNCGHSPKHVVSISGTEIRKKLMRNERPDERFLRPEVADALIALGERKFLGAQK